MSWLVLVESNTTGSGRLFCARARELGLRPVVLTRDPARYPYLLADRVETRCVDTADPEAVLATCVGLGGRVAGVTSSSEYYVAIGATVARWLGLPHPDPDAVGRCRDKAAQRDRLDRAGIPGAVAAAAGTVDEAIAAAERIGFPVVIKPVAGSGSVATRRCDDAGSAATAARAVLANLPGPPVPPPHRAVVIEEYLPGSEYSVETFGGQVVGVTRKRLGAEPYFVEVGHDFPAPLTPAVRAAVSDIALAALRALGLGWGPAHVEVRYAAGGPRIVEVNPRLAGGMIPRLVQLATGMDLVRHTIERATCGVELPAVTFSGAASIRFVVGDAGGRLVAIHGLADVKRLPGVVEARLTSEPGRELVIEHSFRDRLGYVIATARKPETAARLADRAVRVLQPELIPSARLRAARR